MQKELENEKLLRTGWFCRRWPVGKKAFSSEKFDGDDFSLYTKSKLNEKSLQKTSVSLTDVPAGHV